MFKDVRLDNFHSSIDCFAYEFFGCHAVSEDVYVFRVWAPHAKSVSLVGSFNDWKEEAGVMTRLSDNESYEIEVNAKIGDTYKFCIVTYDGRKLYKADPYAFCSDLPNSYASKIADVPLSGDYIRKAAPDQPINIYEVNLLSWRKRKNSKVLK